MRDERLKTRRPRLKHGGQFKRPRGVGFDPPPRVRADEYFRLYKIGGVVRAKAESGSRFGPRRQPVEQIRLEHAVFVVPPLRPWVGEEQEDHPQLQCGRETFEAFPRLGPDKTEIAQLGPMPFPLRPRDAVTGDIDPEAEFRRMGRRVSG